MDEAPAPPPPPSAGSGTSQASRPGHRRHSSAISSAGWIMNAVERASATAAGDPPVRPGGTATQAAARPRTGTAGARVQDVVALPHPRRAQGLPARRDPGQDPAVPGPGRAQGQGPPVPVRGGLQGQDRAEPAVHESAADLPLLQHLRHAVDRVALADAAQVEAGSAVPRVDGELVRVELEALAAPSRSRRRRPRRSGRRRATRSPGTPSSTGSPGWLCPAARWLMREMSLFSTNRLSSCSSRSTRSKAACAAWAA